jgi:hypothetical protein
VYLDGQTHITAHIPRYEKCTSIAQVSFNNEGGYSPKSIKKINKM